MSEPSERPFTIDELTVLVLQHSRARMAKRKAARELLISAREDERLKAVYLEIAKRIARENEAKESKMKLRGILLSVLMLVVLLMVSMTVVGAQEATPEPLATLLATPEVTLDAPVEPLAPADTTVSIWSMLLDKIGDIAMIAAIIVLAFMTGKLIPAEVVLKSFDNGATLIKTITAATPTPADDNLVSIIAEVTRRVIAEELAKRDAPPTTVSGTLTAEFMDDFRHGFDPANKG